MDENVQNGAENTTEEHGSLIGLFVDFWKEIFDFFKYIFYDLLLGRPA